MSNPRNASTDRILPGAVSEPASFEGCAAGCSRRAGSETAAPSGAEAGAGLAGVDCIVRWLLIALCDSSIQNIESPTIVRRRRKETLSTFRSSGVGSLQRQLLVRPPSPFRDSAR